MKELRQTHEVWIEVRGTCGTLVGGALIGLIYRDETGTRHEALAAHPAPETRGHYRKIGPEGLKPHEGRTGRGIH